MYDSFDAFRKDALVCGSTYYSDSSLQPQKIDVAYRIYQNVKKGTKLLDADENTIEFGVTIVGRLALKKKSTNADGKEEDIWLPSDESFPSIDQIMKENLKTVNEESDQIGSILDAKNWSLLCNDSWLLGGIHAKTEFHFASPLSWSNLWDEKGKRMTVTAREVLGITTHGYKITRPNPTLEAVTVCVDEKKVIASSLITYKNQVQKYQTYDTLLEFFKTLSPEVTHYP